MKLPKQTKRYCPSCKKHTEHKIAPAKKKSPSSLNWGSKYRMQARGKCTGSGNQGKLSKGALTKWKRYGKKATKKTDLRYTCGDCKKTHCQKEGFRAKKVEFA